ncbi:TPA: hypothetical protein IAA87_09140 [Candidatus Avigastranaerophilus faecigallinarum]|nr:hypothetical protein [Candidatus Avigastranaerophilus faecigallinarum]
MSDDRLFVSNNAIGRKWYFINIFILTIIAFLTQTIFINYIIPNVTSEVHEIIAKWILYIAYLFFLITFFALIERRLFDICGKRDTKVYKNTSAILKLAVFCQILSLYCQWQKPTIPISYSTIDFIAMIMDLIFFIVVFILGFIKGKISCLTYEEYRQKIKYE